FQICTIDVTGANLRQLTEGPGRNEEPSWSPNGFHIAYTASSGGRREIFVMRYDGAQKRRLSSRAGEQYAPAWSPNVTMRD
ncbi:MAG: PD40 domain-containing protein, partial [Calditrichaeota bacterium]|nr:PD40 domain-containing protein [Calditrichota bacterium]